jgi:hypothetical protein
VHFGLRSLRSLTSHLTSHPPLAVASDSSRQVELQAALKRLEFEQAEVKENYTRARAQEDEWMKEQQKVEQQKKQLDKQLQYRRKLERLLQVKRQELTDEDTDMDLEKSQAKISAQIKKANARRQEGLYCCVVGVI